MAPTAMGLTWELYAETAISVQFPSKLVTIAPRSPLMKRSIGIRNSHPSTPPEKVRAASLGPMMYPTPVMAALAAGVSMNILPFIVLVFAISTLSLLR
ncbi:hypothetical protein ES703_26784 [subsurface metagenome]